MNNKFFLYLFASCMILLSANSLAGDHTVSTTIEISATGINRFLNAQYNATGFPRSVTVAYNGTNYTLALTLPQIILTQNNAALKMIFDVTSGSTSIYHFTANPSINIPSEQINAAQVQAFLTDLPAQLNSISAIPQWVRDAVIANYNSLGITIYPSKLIDQVNTSWFSQVSIDVVSPYFALGWQVSDGLLSLVVTTYLDAEAHKIGVALIQDATGTSIGIQSNFQLTVKEALLYQIDGNTPLASVQPNSVIEKEIPTSFSIGQLGLPTTEVYLFYAVYVNSSSNGIKTWYSREYKLMVNAFQPNGNRSYLLETKSDN
jgi:hypothetical protein